MGAVVKPDRGPAGSTSSSRSDAFVGAWAWLFPATYLLHVAEEYWVAPGFPAWASDFAPVELSVRAFLVANALFFALMATTVALVVRRVWGAWLLVALATIVTINGILHLGGTLLTASYSPGLVSGVVLWVTLGVVTLVRAGRMCGALGLRLGVGAGILVHLLVPLVALVLAGLLGVER